MYPLLLEPVLMPKVWGGDRLSRFAKALRPGDCIGESWEVADLGSTSASGAGGSAVRSRIRNGALAGKTLHDAMAHWAPGMLGEAAAMPNGGFPLLVKLLDARENLSIQVHPSPAYCAAHPDAELKTECWYILEAAPGSMIYKGVRPGVTPAQLEASIADGTVVDRLLKVPAIAGQCHNLPSGTVHALGAGVLVAEVQTPSDTTFRVFDWGRTGRALHITESLACIDFAPPPPPVDMRHGGELRTEFFSVRSRRLDAGEKAPALTAGRCTIIMVLRGTARIDEVPLALGDTAVVPAALAASARLQALTDAELMLATVEPRPR